MSNVWAVPRGEATLVVLDGSGYPCMPTKPTENILPDKVNTRMPASERLMGEGHLGELRRLSGHAPSQGALGLRGSGAQGLRGSALYVNAPSASVSNWLKMWESIVSLAWI